MYKSIFLSLKKIQKIQRANATTIGICCKWIPPKKQKTEIRVSSEPGTGLCRTWFCSLTAHCFHAYTTSSPPFFLRDSRASETWARVKITPREKRRHAAGREKNHACSRFARSTIPEEKWGTTRSLFYAILAIAIVLLGSIKPSLQEQDFLVKDNFTRSCWQAENHLYPE